MTALEMSGAIGKLVMLKTEDSFASIGSNPRREASLWTDQSLCHSYVRIGSKVGCSG